MANRKGTLHEIDFLDIFEKSAGSNILIKANPPTYTIIAVTDEYLRITNTKREEITGKGVFEVFPDNPDAQEKPGLTEVAKAFSEVIKTQKEVALKPYSYSIYLPEEKKYKTLYWVNQNKPILNEEGEVAYILNTTQDVTEKVRLQQNEEKAVRNLHYQQERINQLLYRAPIGIMVLKGSELVIEYANENISNILQARSEPITGRSLFEVVPESKEDFEKIFEDILYNGKPFSGKAIKTKVVRDGKPATAYFNMQYLPIYEADGRISGIFCSSFEVTEEISIRKALEESEHRLYTAIESSGAGIWDTNILTGESIRSVKHAQIFGYPDNSHPWSLQLLLSHILPEDSKQALKSIEEGYRSGEINFQTRIKTIEGLIRWVNISGKVYFNEKNEPVRMLGTTTDITARKELERQKDEFLSIISHELKTPVTSIKAYTQLLQRHYNDENPQMMNMLEKMDTQITRLNLLVKDLLDVSRIEGSKLRLNNSKFEFNQLVTEITEEMRLLHPAYNFIVNLTEPIEVCYDKERIIQVLTNLIGNAVKYSPKNKNIIISVSKNGSEIICQIKDMGIGISKESQKEIFNRFYQVMDGKINSFPGLGLGLYISAEIIRRQNGNIWVESDPGQGSSFYFSLPLN